MVEGDKQLRRIREIDPLQEKERSAWLRSLPRLVINFYRGHLKKYDTFHSLATWIYRGIVPIYLKIYWNLYPTIYLKSYWYLYPKYLKIYWYFYPLVAKTYYASEHLKFQKRRLVKLNDIVKRESVMHIKLADSVTVEIPAPKVFPASDQKNLNSFPERYTFPEIYVANLKNAIIYGGTNLVMHGDKIICHDLFDFKRDFTSEELHRRTIIYPKSQCIRWLRIDEDPVPIPVAAIFVDACAQNYAHWLTEVLPRICFFCADERYKDVSIVVNAGLHQNIMESLFLVAGDEREVITLPNGRALSVDELYLTSATGYVPFERRTNKLKSHSHGVFSPRAFEMLRNHLSRQELKTEEQTWPEKIFLRRNSGTRKVINAAELEKLMVSRGYVIVEPEKLTFTQQVQLFKNARTIIAPTGAALANAIFCMPRTQVTVLMGKHESMIYRYWCNMLAPLEIEVSYILGNIVGSSSHGIHGDFVVNIADSIDLLETLENK